jgi:hypothetical protein
VCMEVIEGADYVVVQEEGQTVYVPPLAHHAVFTLYSEKVSPEERFTLLCGTFFADVRRCSLWRESISLWMRSHQTGFQHGNKKSVLKKYAKYVKSPAVRRGPSKRQRRSEKASKDSKTVERVMLRKTSGLSYFSPPAQWEVFELVDVGCSVGGGVAERAEYRNGFISI